jgi:hypothetical protein
MATAPPPSFERDFGAAVANLRDTAKWIVGAVATTAAGVLIGAPLAKFGALPPDTLAVAVGAVVCGIMLLGVLYTLAVAVIAVEALDIAGLGATQGIARFRALRLQHQLRDLMPAGYPTFHQLARRTAELDQAADTDVAAKQELKALNDQIDVLAPQLSFQNKLMQFKDLQKGLLICTPLLVICICVLSYEANRPAHEPLSEKPVSHLIETADDLDTRAALGYQPGCYAAAAGKLAVPVVFVADYQDYADVISLPKAPCLARRLQLKGNRLVSK